jgi:hypothetical protein
MYRFFAPVMFSKRFNFFGTTKEGTLNERLINRRDQFSGLAGIACEKAQ